MMNAKPILAILLIVIGVIAFVYQGITYTTREKAVDLGAVQITTEKIHRLPLPPIIGAVSLLLGLVLLIRSSRQS
jgi:hypothetical protein